MMGNLHHVSFTCRSLKASQQFYQQFDFNEEKRYQDEEVTIVLLKSRAGTRIELFHFHSNTSSDVRDFMSLKPIGISHIALTVPDLDACLELVRSGAKCSPITRARMGGFRYFFTTDPDGNNVEFIATDTE
ncbi:VOC family protein [Vibrio profundum]|uniref:VOC family protein n=1 Tax=Vibrio profundum TaxID=2910247 RepID=UPI003D0C212A